MCVGVYYMGTIFISGTYGVGKSTLCQKLSNELLIPSYSASELISAANDEEYGISEAVSNKVLNQNILISEIKRLLATFPQLLLAGHFCIFDKNNQVDYLPKTVFFSLGIDRIILLETSISQIKQNLFMRDNKDYSYQHIMNLKNAEKQSAKMIAQELGCELFIHDMFFDDRDVSLCLNIIKGKELA